MEVGTGTAIGGQQDDDRVFLPADLYGSGFWGGQAPPREVRRHGPEGGGAAWRQ